MNDKNLEHELLQEYMYLVVSHALKYFNTPVTDIDDYKQIGYIALLKASRSYDPARGTQFGTYAWKAIKNAIQKEITKFYPKNKHRQLSENIAYNSIESIWQIVPDSLTYEEQVILEYRLQNMSLREIADIMGYSKDWINRLLNNAILKIKKANDA